MRATPKLYMLRRPSRSLFLNLFYRYVLIVSPKPFFNSGEENAGSKKLKVESYYRKNSVSDRGRHLSYHTNRLNQRNLLISSLKKDEGSNFVNLSKNTTFKRGTGSQYLASADHSLLARSSDEIQDIDDTRTVENSSAAEGNRHFIGLGGLSFSAAQRKFFEASSRSQRTRERNAKLCNFLDDYAAAVSLFSTMVVLRRGENKGGNKMSTFHTDKNPPEKKLLDDFCEESFSAQYSSNTKGFIKIPHSDDKEISSLGQAVKPVVELASRIIIRSLKNYDAENSKKVNLSENEKTQKYAGEKDRKRSSSENSEDHLYESISLNEADVGLADKLASDLIEAFPSLITVAAKNLFLNNDDSSKASGSMFLITLPCEIDGKPFSLNINKALHRREHILSLVRGTSLQNASTIVSSAAASGLLTHSAFTYFGIDEIELFLEEKKMRAFELRSAAELVPSAMGPDEAKRIITAAMGTLARIYDKFRGKALRGEVCIVIDATDYDEQHVGCMRTVLASIYVAFENIKQMLTDKRNSGLLNSYSDFYNFTKFNNFDKDQYGIAEIEKIVAELPGFKEADSRGRNNENKTVIKRHVFQSVSSGKVQRIIDESYGMIKAHMTESVSQIEFSSLLLKKDGLRRSKFFLNNSDSMSDFEDHVHDSKNSRALPNKLSPRVQKVASHLQSLNRNYVCSEDGCIVLNLHSLGTWEDFLISLSQQTWRRCVALHRRWRLIASNIASGARQSGMQLLNGGSLIASRGELGTLESFNRTLAVLADIFGVKYLHCGPVMTGGYSPSLWAARIITEASREKIIAAQKEHENESVEFEIPELVPEVQHDFFAWQQDIVLQLRQDEPLIRATLMREGIALPGTEMRKLMKESGQIVFVSDIKRLGGEKAGEKLAFRIGPDGILYINATYSPIKNSRDQDSNNDLAFSSKNKRCSNESRKIFEGSQEQDNEELVLDADSEEVEDVGAKTSVISTAAVLRIFVKNAATMIQNSLAYRSTLQRLLACSDALGLEFILGDDLVQELMYNENKQEKAVTNRNYGFEQEINGGKGYLAAGTTSCNKDETHSDIASNNKLIGNNTGNTLFEKDMLPKIKRFASHSQTNGMLCYAIQTFCLKIEQNKNQIVMLFNSFDDCLKISNKTKRASEKLNNGKTLGFTRRCTWILRAPGSPLLQVSPTGVIEIAIDFFDREKSIVNKKTC